MKMASVCDICLARYSDSDLFSSILEGMDVCVSLAFSVLYFWWLKIDSYCHTA